MTAHAPHPSPLGTLMLVADDTGLRAVLWPDDDPKRVRLPEHTDDPTHPVLVDTGRQLDEYFAGRRRRFELPLAPAGTPFQLEVWTALAGIAHGTTTSYGALARHLGRPTGARAVAAAVGRNPLSIVVPCHRVLGADGSLTGFAGGLGAKRWLLEHERSAEHFPEHPAV